MAAPVIEVRNVGKTFAHPVARRNTIREHVFAGFSRRGTQQFTVLEDVTFDVQPGEALGLMGANGSGKSTLLKIVSGIYVPDRGDVIRRAPITPILELGVGWNGELDAVDNVYVVASLMGLPLGRIRAALDEILAFAELESFANLKLKHYSSGMSARLAYAVAFQAVQDVLILDEIFAVGDVAFRHKCVERYLALKASGHTIILVSHAPDLISSYCDRAILLDHGRLTMSGTAAQVARAYMERMGGHAGSQQSLALAD